MVLELDPRLVEDAVKLLYAVALGGAVGLERERLDKPAGLRTNILIALGSTLLTILSVRVSEDAHTGDPGRIAAQIVTGVGFLGAGSILQSRASVVGLTTAATIWAVAAIGMAVGAGYVDVAAFATGLILLCLTLLRPIERWLQPSEQQVLLRISLSPEAPMSDVMNELSRCTLKVESTAGRRSTKAVKMEVRCLVEPKECPRVVSAILALDGVTSVVAEQ